MNELDIETKLALISMTYDGRGKLTKFTDDIYGFCNSNGSVNFIRLSDMTIVRQEYHIKYMLDKVIVVYTLDNSDLTNVKSCILSRNTFNIIATSQYRLDVVNNIIYESNNIMMYNHGDNTLTRRIFDEQGRFIGSIEVYSDVSIEYIECTDYYIVRHKQIGVIREHVTICKISTTVEVIWNSNDYEVYCIGDGIYSFSRYSMYEDTRIYNFYRQLLMEP